MKKLIIMALALCLALCPVCRAEAAEVPAGEPAQPSAAERFLGDLETTWGSFKEMVGEAGQGVADWAEESGIAEWAEETAGSVSQWAEETIGAAQSWINETAPEVEGWLNEARERIGNAWESLVAPGSVYHPEIEVYPGIWKSDDCELEIVHMMDDYALVNCNITRNLGDGKGINWAYDACAYDEATGALISQPIGMRCDVTLDEEGYIVDNDEAVYTDGVAAFIIDSQGRLTWTDFKAAAGENTVVFERVEGPEALEEEDPED